MSTFSNFNIFSRYWRLCPCGPSNRWSHGWIWKQWRHVGRRQRRGEWRTSRWCHVARFSRTHLTLHHCDENVTEVTEISLVFFVESEKHLKTDNLWKQLMCVWTFQAKRKITQHNCPRAILWSNKVRVLRHSKTVVPNLLHLKSRHHVVGNLCYQNESQWDESNHSGTVVSQPTTKAGKSLFRGKVHYRMCSCQLAF